MVSPSLQVWGEGLQEAVQLLVQCLICGALSHIDRSHRSRIQELEMGMAPLTINPNDQLAKLSLPIPVTLYSTGVEVLVSKGWMLPTGSTTVIPLNKNLRLPPSHFRLLMPLNQGKGGSYSVSWHDWSDYQGETGPLLHNGGKAVYAWNIEGPSKHTIMLCD